MPWGLMGSGLLWAGLDESFAFHEFIGANTPVLRDSTLTTYPDDLVVLSYLCIAAAVFLYYLPAFRSRRLPILVLVLAACCQTAGAVGGGFNFQGFQEEGAEVVGALLYLVALLLYAREDSHM
ncbi:MAG: hypothetical protein AAB393_03685, partial [Bacteroidota bacterium]